MLAADSERLGIRHGPIRWLARAPDDARDLRAREHTMQSGREPRNPRIVG